MREFVGLIFNMQMKPESPYWWSLWAHIVFLRKVCVMTCHKRCFRQGLVGSTQDRPRILGQPSVCRMGSTSTGIGWSVLPNLEATYARMHSVFRDSTRVWKPSHTVCGESREAERRRGRRRCFPARQRTPSEMNDINSWSPTLPVHYFIAPIQICTNRCTLPRNFKAFVSQKPVGCSCKEYGGMEVYLRIFIQRWAESFTLDHFISLWKEPRQAYLLYRVLGGYKNWSRKSLSPCPETNLSFPVTQTITKPLYWLGYSGCTASHVRRQ
jgi:hypothetical protein